MDDDEKKIEADKVRRELEASIDALRELQGKASIFETKDDESIVPEPPFCSFCGKGRNQVKHMLPGNNAYICDQCVTLCQEIVSGVDKASQ